MNLKLKIFGVLICVFVSIVSGAIYEQFSERATAEKLISDVLNSQNSNIISFNGTKTENDKITGTGYGIIDLKNKKLYLHTENTKKQTSTEIYFIDNNTYVRFRNLTQEGTPKGEWFRPKHFIAFEWMFNSTQNKNWDAFSFISSSMNGENILEDLTSFSPVGSDTLNITLVLKGIENINGQKCRIVESDCYNPYATQTHKKYWVAEDSNKVVQIEEIMPEIKNIRNETTLKVKYYYDDTKTIILPKEAENASIAEIPFEIHKSLEIGMKGSKTAAKVGSKESKDNETIRNETMRGYETNETKNISQSYAST